MLAVRLPEVIEERLDRLAKKTGRAKSFYVREALSEYLAVYVARFLDEDALALY